MTETEYISQSLTKIRRFARLYRLHFWIIAHPAKMHRADDGSYPAPTPYDISGSSHWYNKADNCITVTRDVNGVTVLVQKVRHRNTGMVGSVELSYDKVCGRYRDGTGPPPFYPPLDEPTQAKESPQKPRGVGFQGQGNVKPII